MISIIIPVYNCEKYVERIYGCVKRQTYSQWELVFVDDGSKDGSLERCEQCARLDSRVEVIHQENKGASVARRVGLQHAKGEYVVFIDCDDMVEDDYVEQLWGCLDKYRGEGIMVAACDMVKHSEDVHPMIDRNKRPCVLDEDELQKRFFQYDFWGFWGKIYCKSVFEDLYFPEYTINEDYVVMAQLLERHKRMAYLPISLYHYMYHGESLSHQKLSKRMFDEFYNKIWVKDFYAEHNRAFLKHAEAQLVETCVKLLRCVRRDDKEGVYGNEEGLMRGYLRNHVFQIMLNKRIKLGVRLVALSLVLSV